MKDVHGLLQIVQITINIFVIQLVMMVVIMIIELQHDVCLAMDYRVIYRLIIVLSDILTMDMKAIIIPFVMIYGADSKNGNFESSSIMA